MTDASNQSPASRTFVLGLSVRFRRRTAAFFGLATGRYWTTGAEHTRWHSDVRLPFFHAGIVRALPDQRPRLRATFMGWRGVDHRPSPDLHEWRWPTAANANCRDTMAPTGEPGIVERGHRVRIVNPTDAERRASLVRSRVDDALEAAYEDIYGYVERGEFTAAEVAENLWQFDLRDGWDDYAAEADS